MHFAIRHVVRCFVLCLVLLSCALAQSRAAQYTLLHGFAGAPGDGANPQFGSLATDGTVLYGFTAAGGTTNIGVVFKINVNGSGYQILHNFTGSTIADFILHTVVNPNDGQRPYGTPLLIGGTLYGTTLYGGTNGTGTIFKINTNGTGFELLHSFGSGGGPSDGYGPYCSLVTDGATLYGMSSSSSSGLGTIFSIGTNGTGYHLLHTFSSSTSDGANPQGSLLLSAGTLYGMTQMGGTVASGTIFKIATNGVGFQLIHIFTGTVTDGALPYGSLIISNSTLYGMTSAGGSNNVGTVFSVDTSGVSFKILHNFSTTKTWGPLGDLTLSGSTLYGMARNSGFSLLGSGTIFQVNTDGSSFQIPHVFSFANPNNLTDGSTPYGSLLLLGSNLYGMTQAGGSAHNAGALFSFTPPSGGGGGSIAGLQVRILPAGAISAGAMWQVDGGAFFKSDVVVTNLSIGPHTVSFKAVTGWAAPSNRLIPVLANFTNFVIGTYTAVDATPPVLKVISPTSKTIVNTNVFTASGTAGDNVGVALVFYQLNSGNWTAAATLNNWTNWNAANLNLSAGVNIMSFYAKDLSGNVSATNTVSFTYVVSAPLVVNLNLPGAGTLKPNLNGQSLQIGKAFSMSTKAVKGYAFVGWTGGTNTTAPKITFVMASNLTFTANFKDITRPVNAILSPTKGQIVTAAEPIATGKAMDNAGVTAVWYQVNSGAWIQANLADGTNWQTASLALLSGANTISAFAQDAAGNASLTNTIVFNYLIQPVMDWAPDSLNGILASVTPAIGSTEAVGFDLSTFSQTSTTNSTDPEDFGGGTYTYLKIDTNLAQLSLSSTLPPGSSNDVGPIDLVFTNHYAGFFTNEDGGKTGQISLTIPTALVPTTVIAKTISAVSSNNGKTIKIKLATATTFTKTPANNSNSGSSSGTYTFKRLSPVCGAFAFSFTSPADLGQTAYVQLTFTSATGGTYFAMVFDILGDVVDTDEGHFAM